MPSWSNAAAVIVGVTALGLGSILWWRSSPSPAVTETATNGTRDASPTVYTYRLVDKYRHDAKAFTQGLLWLNGSLYESTGLYGQSSVREVRLQNQTARTVRRVSMAREHFGEGLVYWQGELLQLLWRRGDGLRYSARAGDGGHLELQGGREFRTPLQDGWGLATDGERLLVTDSGPDVFTLDPATMELISSVRVTDAGRPVEMLNELEVVDGELWANVFGKECLARIALDGSGTVLGWVVLDGLLDWRKARAAAHKKGRDPPDVMNGIAWDPADRRLFVTGKLWPWLFEIEVVPTTDISIEEARRLCIPERNIFRGD